MLGALLGTMLVGLSILVHRQHVAPRGGVTVLAQLTAGSFGTGWAYPMVGYVRKAAAGNRQIAVLIVEVQPRRWRYRILQNQRGLLLGAVLRASTDVVICTIPYRLITR
jgi:hypothetical protein